MYGFLFDLTLRPIEDYATTSESVVSIVPVPKKKRRIGHAGGIPSRRTRRDQFISMPWVTEERIAKSNDLTWGDVWDYTVGIVSGVTNMVLAVSPVPTIPSWLIDLAEHIDQSQDEYY